MADDDADGPETTEIVIFADDERVDSGIHLSVGRITSEPVAQTAGHRLPRPDDPTPRRPPPVLVSKGRDKRAEQQSNEAVFKVPPGKGKRKLDEDFCGTELVGPDPKGKRKQTENEEEVMERDNKTVGRLGSTVACD